jgi:hypothetical protein
MTSPLLRRYIDLETFLVQHAGLWQPAPFHSPIPPWAATHDTLYNALLALSDTDTQRLEHDADALWQWLCPFLPALQPLPGLIALPSEPRQQPKPWPTGFEWDIPGRKWSQIEAFTACVQPRTPRLIDWCAGKGHLSRSLAFQHDTDVLSLEWNAALCDAAKTLNHKQHARVTTLLQDVMAADAGHHLGPDCHCVALHACGKLHLRLMATASLQRAAALSFSPCCYHLIDTVSYQPLMVVDPQLLPQRLQPDRDQLRLAVQETVTANGHARRLRERKSAWRLGFRAWLDTAHPQSATRLPTLADHCFHGRFEDFCVLAAETMGIALPSHLPWERLESSGWKAHARLQRLELVRHGFRRALEVWLCLDRACWLEQQGYEVRVSTFCPSQATPRNILIDATRSRSGQASPG